MQQKQRKYKWRGPLASLAYALLGCTMVYAAISVFGDFIGCPASVQRRGFHEPTQISNAPSQADIAIETLTDHDEDGITIGEHLQVAVISRIGNGTVIHRLDTTKKEILLPELKDCTTDNGRPIRQAKRITLYNNSGAPHGMQEIAITLRPDCSLAIQRSPGSFNAPTVTQRRAGMSPQNPTN